MITDRVGKFRVIGIVSTVMAELVACEPKIGPSLNGNISRIGFVPP